MLKTFEQFIFGANNSTFNIKSRSSFYAINESQESKSQSAAIKLLMDKLGWDHHRADKFVREDLRNDITALRDKNIAKFTLGVTRMFVDGELKDARIISNLDATLKLLSAHLDEYDRNLKEKSSGVIMSVEELISKFKQARENNVKKEKQEINRIKFSVSDYEIVKIDSFNDAKKYYKYTNPSSRWCLTHISNMFDTYTCDGINQIYFCLRNGFKNIKPIVGKNAPLDEYGLSMLSIIVNEEGELAYCTTRWNHVSGGNDSAMDAVEISKVVNVNFYETFKPNTKWKDMVDNAKQRLANGEEPEDVFDDVDDFVDGYAKVELNYKYNFINTDGKILSDKWFDYVYKFVDGYVAVELNGKWNFINTDGKYLYDKWFDEASDFQSGYAAVKLKEKWNFISADDEYLSNEWFDYIYDFNDAFVDGYAAVELNGKKNFINTDGKFVSDKWFDDIGHYQNGCIVVELNGKMNFINAGKFISDKWFDDVWDFKDGYAEIKLNGKYNFINTDGKILSDKWFDDAAEVFYKGYTRVKLNGEWMKINTKGEFIPD